MGSDGISEVGEGAGERVGRMMNGTSLTLGSIARSGAYVLVMLQNIAVMQYCTL